MNFKKATAIVLKTLKNKQDPDKVTFEKTWDETGRLKGYDVYCFWGEHKVLIDITDDYTRVVGSIDKVPDYIKGKNQKV